MKQLNNINKHKNTSLYECETCGKITETTSYINNDITFYICSKCNRYINNDSIVMEDFIR